MVHYCILETLHLDFLCFTLFFLPNLRDLSEMRNELSRVSHSAHVSCSGLSATLQGREGGTVLTLEREKALRVQLEQQLRERVAEMMTLQMRTDTERSELSLRSVCCQLSHCGKTPTHCVIVHIVPIATMESDLQLRCLTSQQQIKTVLVLEVLIMETQTVNIKNKGVEYLVFKLNLN